MRRVALLLILALAGCDAVLERYGMARYPDCEMLRDNAARIEACTAVIRTGSFVQPVILRGAYLNRAQVHQSEGRREQALADYLAVLELDEDHPIALLKAAEMLVGLEREAEATPLLIRAAERNNSGIARQMLGQIALSRGDYADAVRYFDGALERTNGESALAMAGRARAKHCLGDADGARADYEAAARLDDQRRPQGEDGQCVQGG